MTDAQGADTPKDIAFEIRQIVRAARRATLATLDDNGGPFASLIITGTDMAGAPVTLISTLARHTQNLERDDRASLLIEAQDGPDDVLARARVTLTGRMAPGADDGVKQRFLAAQPSAAGYAGFADFSYYRFQADQAHLVAGFGRIYTVSDGLTLADGEACAALAEMEAGAVQHMNEDHADALGLYATVLLGLSGSGWRATGIDPEGIDLACAEASARLSFPDPVTDGQQLRRTLADLAMKARDQARMSS